MGDKPRVIDYQVQLHGNDTSINVDVVQDTDAENALKVKGYVKIEGSDGAQATFSVANRMESSQIDPSINGWNTILNLSVPSGKTWYLKGMGFGSTRSCEFRLTIGGTTKYQGNLDASDSIELPLYGFLVGESVSVTLDINTTANQTLKANLVIYEETN